MLSIITLLMLSIVMSSCGALSTNTKVITVSKQLEGDIDLEYGGRRFGCHVSRPDTYSCSLEVLYPDGLAGLKLMTDGEKTSLEYLGLSYELENEKLPEAGALTRIISAIDSLPDVISADDGAFDQQDGSYMSVAGGHAFKAYFNEDGAVSKLIFES